MKLKLLGLLMLVATCSAQATVTTVAQYRLGESDPGATPGASGANPTVPSTGAVNLARNGAPTYSAMTPSFVTSTLSMAFAGGIDRYSGATVSTATDNFGIEAWVRSNGSTAVNAVIAYNGNIGSSGWGLFQFGNEFGFLYGGVAAFGVTPVTSAWTHLALIRDAGTTRYFVNGQLRLVADDRPAVPAGGFFVGGNPLNPLVATEGFDGLVDDVQMFSFLPGQFSVSDLNLGNPPQPPAFIPAGSTFSSLLLAALLLASALLVWRGSR